jgi:hypothetical protein
MPDKTFRPLKGVRKDISTQSVPDGNFFRAVNVMATPRGLERRPTLDTAFNDDDYWTSGWANVTQGHPVQMLSYWNPDGDVETFLLTEQQLYQCVWDSGISEVQNDPALGGTWSTADGLTFTHSVGGFTSASDLNVIEAGEWYQRDTFTPGEISTVGASTVTVTVAQGTSDTGFTGDIWKLFNPDPTNEFLPDFTFTQHDLVFCCGGINGLWFLDGTAGSRYNSPYVATLYSKAFKASAIGFFQERLWIGDMVEWNSGSSAHERYRYRIRYSDALAPQTFDDDSYLDLDYSSGKVMRIIPLGNLLAIYFNDAIYLGYPGGPVNYPVTFDKLETGSIGLVGKYAIAPYADGHFFIGPDNVYHLTTQGPPKPIGTPILEDSIRDMTEPWRAMAIVDEFRNRILFGLPTGGNTSITEVWSFNLLTGEWTQETYTDYELWMISKAYIDKGITWAGTSSFTIANIATTYPTGDSFLSSNEGAEPVFASSEKLRVLIRSGEIDTNPNDTDTANKPVEVILESKDHDLDIPHENKRFRRLSLKIDFQDDVPLTSDLTFTCQYSGNKGRDWYDAPDLVIPAGSDEGFTTFVLRSSHMRFRLTSTDEVPPWIGTEYSLRIFGGGRESFLGTQE